MSSNKLFVATDGGTRGNGKTTCRASYAYVIIDQSELPIIEKERQRIITGGKESSDNDSLCTHEHTDIVSDGIVATNNRGELYGIKEALSAIDTECLLGDILIISDSEYSIKSIDIWSRNWNAQSVLTKSNVDLIMSIRSHVDELRKSRKVEFKHIKSHKAMPDLTDPEHKEKFIYWFLNKRVDALSQEKL